MTDTQRLAWLEAKDAQLHRVLPPDDRRQDYDDWLWEVWFNGGPDGDQSAVDGATLRDAIDAGMKLTGDAE